MNTSDIVGELFYAAIIAVAGLTDYLKSKSKASLLFGTVIYTILTFGAFQQAIDPLKCTIFATTAGLLAVICPVVTIILRLIAILNNEFYKKYSSRSETYGILSIFSIFRYFAARGECTGSLDDIFLYIFRNFSKIFQIIIIIPDGKFNLLNGIFNFFLMASTFFVLRLNEEFELLDQRFFL
ncbi:uncharacterized protein LOC128668921 [Microplitis demolitor]|uniref:uncharacterized protein LOC128668921 n=1 Tax=Microplitis demolitor TaxID=69319 RepID=UPI00235B6779|nr:uncharacterized protein LOC128668921 [Microplitis demolitor]